MSRKHHFELLASYNQWMNSKLCEAASHLSAVDLSKDRGAFFGSILGTLNHLIVADNIWLKRFAAHPSCLNSLSEVSRQPNPTSLDQILFDDFSSLHEHRTWLDEQIIAWVGGLSEDDLDYVLSYHNTKGVPANKRFSSLLLHFLITKLTIAGKSLPYYLSRALM